MVATSMSLNLNRKTKNDRSVAMLRMAAYGCVWMRRQEETHDRTKPTLHIYKEDEGSNHYITGDLPGGREGAEQEGAVRR